ncbi:MAG: hypothetical protein IT448_10380 [Phycisphaerales bacterium]|nr:hypothetical protein [Phycisphaerales bacterium]
MRFRLILSLILLVGLVSVSRGQPTEASQQGMTDSALQEHDGYKGIWLRTAQAEVFVALKPKFLLLSLQRPGQSSLLGDATLPEQGIRLMVMKPSQTDDSPVPGRQPAKLLNRGISSARVQLDPGADLQYLVELRLSDEAPVLEITYELKNVGQHEQYVAAWSLASFARDGQMVIPFGRQPKANRRLVLPWWSPWPQSTIAMGRDTLLIDAGAPVVSGFYKMGVITDAGWSAFVRGSQALVRMSAYENHRSYPEDGANVTVYQADADEPERRGWCELELVWPLEKLLPQQTSRQQETIRLISLTKAPVEEKNADAGNVDTENSDTGNVDVPKADVLRSLIETQLPFLVDQPQ